MRGRERVRDDLPRGPAGPAVGQMLAIKRHPFGALDGWREQYGERFTMRSPGVPPMVFLSDPAEVREMFAAPAEVLRPGEGGALLMPIVGEQSFMLSDGAAHRRGRTVLREAFTMATAERHREHVHALAVREVSRWPVGRPVAAHGLLRGLALRIVFEVVFGDVKDGQVERLFARVLSMLEVTSTLVLNVPPARRLPYGRMIWRRFLRERAAVDALIYGMINERRRRGDVAAGTLGILLAARDDAGLPLPAEYVRDSVMSVLVAGHETTSSALAWTLLLLAHSPQAQERANEEIDAGVGPAYLLAVIYEALRHRPVFLFAIPRVVTEPVQIGEYRYAPPVSLMACIYLIHHDPQIYEDPHRFLPERFLARRPDPAVWLPWGGGRKRCPGRHFALLEMQSVLAAVLRRLRVEPASRRLEEGAWRSFIVSPSRGAQVILRAR